MGSTSSSFATALKKVKGLLKEAKETIKERGGFSSGFAEIQDGRYEARLTSMELEKSQSSGRLQVKEVWEVAKGEFEGEKKYAYQGMDSQDNIINMLRRIDTLGYEQPDGPEEFEEIFEAASEAQPLCQITLKTKGDFQNVYIDRLIESETEDEDEDEEIEDDADEVEEEEVEEDADDESEEDEDEDEDSDDEVEEDDEDEDEDDEEDSEDDEEEEEVDLDALSRAELKALITEQKLDIKITKKMSDQDIRDAIGEAVGDDEEDEEDEEEIEVPEKPKKAPAKKAPAKKKTTRRKK